MRALVEAGHQVRVLDDFSTGKKERIATLPIEVVRADVRSGPAVRRALDGAQAVFHLAGSPAPPQATHTEVLRAEDVNVAGAINVFAQAAREHVRRVVVASSAAVFGKSSAYVLHEDVSPQPATPWAVQKLAVEHYARVYREQHGVPTVTLRLARCFGPGEPWRGASLPLVPALCRAAFEGTPPRLTGEGRQSRDLLYIDNVVSALCAAAWAPGAAGGLYNVASGEAISVVEVWHQIARLVGFEQQHAAEPEMVPLPRWEPVQQRLSIAHARRHLGWMPLVPLREGLKRTVEHYRLSWLGKDNGWFAPPELRAADDPLAEPVAPAVAPTEPPRPPPLPPALALASRIARPAASAVELDAGDLVEVEDDVGFERADDGVLPEERA